MTHAPKVHHGVRATLVAALLATGTIAPVRAAEPAIAPERNPPGDIPDSQVFVTYASPRGYVVKVPEGWSRTEGPAVAVFASRYDVIAVSVEPAVGPSSVAEVEAGEVARLAAQDRAISIGGVVATVLPAGRSVKISYASNSELNPVTGKRIRLKNERYVIDGVGRRATLTLSAPAGADNADQWTLVAGSFRWK